MPVWILPWPPKQKQWSLPCLCSSHRWHMPCLLKGRWIAKIAPALILWTGLLLSTAVHTPAGTHCLFPSILVSFTLLHQWVFSNLFHWSPMSWFVQLMRWPRRQDRLKSRDRRQKSSIWGKSREGTRLWQGWGGGQEQVSKREIWDRKVREITLHSTFYLWAQCPHFLHVMEVELSQYRHWVKSLQRKGI